MNRRTFLKHAATLPALPALAPLIERVSPTLAAATTAAEPFRRVRPSDTDWPTPAQWDSLKKQVGGRLIAVADPLAPCKSLSSSSSSSSSSTAAACDARLDELKNPFWLNEQAGATHLSGWLDAWTSSPSVYAVAAKSAQDVAFAVEFARARRLRLVVKGGGHSYLGNSNAPDSLLIWTHEMRAIILNDAFKPKDCPTSSAHKAVTIEAGARWIDVYDAVTTRAGRYVQGGGCTTVGVVGLLTGGGFGSFSKMFGMAAASLLEAEVVTADGKIRVANACTNPALFWALKGGGGGTFGVVTKVTLATHDLPGLAGGAFGKVHAKSDAAMRRLVEWFVRFYVKSLFNAHWGESVKIGKDALEINMVCVGLTAEESEAAWRPLRDLVKASPEEYEWADDFHTGVMPTRYWWDPEWRAKHTPGVMVTDPRPGAPKTNIWWKGDGGQASAFIYGYESVWLPAGLLRESADSIARLADALFAASRQFETQLHFNKGLAGGSPEGIAASRDTATNPAVLDAFALAIIATGDAFSNATVPGHTPDAAKGHEEARRITAAADALRSVSPNGGSYANETNYFEKSFQTSFWGTNHARLAEVKKQYDPEGLFFVHNGVGSERWSRDGFERLR